MESQKELEFAIFCIENVALQLEKSGDEIYHALAEKSRILQDYIVPCYEVLHTQSKEYIVDDIIALMREKEVL